jgi:hypothetical protein
MPVGATKSLRATCSPPKSLEPASWSTKNTLDVAGIAHPGVTTRVWIGEQKGPSFGSLKKATATWFFEDEAEDRHTKRE